MCIGIRQNSVSPRDGVPLAEGSGECVIGLPVRIGAILWAHAGPDDPPLIDVPIWERAMARHAGPCYGDTFDGGGLVHILWLR